MFWKKNEKTDENYKKILEILQLLQTQYLGLVKEIEFLQLKFRKLAHISKKKDDIEEETEQKIDDPFGDIRKLRKNLKMEGGKIGI